MVQTVNGKLKPSDEKVAQILSWTPWLSSVVVALPLPVIFLVFYLGAATTESAAIDLLLLFLSMGFGLVAGLSVLIFLLLYRRRWYGRMRDRLAADGITASEVRWFTAELSSEERAVWQDLKQKDSLLADAYGETLAARLTASRIIGKTRGIILRIERQLNRTRNIASEKSSSLTKDLLLDLERMETLQAEAHGRLSEATAQLQMIVAAANRTLDQRETDLMLQRLAVSQQQIPLALELANREREAMSEIIVPQVKLLTLDQQSGNEPKQR